MPLLAAASSTYSIQGLTDPAQVNAFFVVPPPQQGQYPVNNTLYLAGLSVNSPSGTSTGAIGTLTGNALSVLPLSPLPGGDSVSLFGTFKDGSGLGYSFQTIPNPNPALPPLQVPTLTRWVNGAPQPVVISDPSEPTANFAPGPIGMNSNGDVVGQYELNGLISAYHYNVFDQSFEVLPLPVGDVFQLIPQGVNDAGQMLFLANGPNTQYLLYDPTTTSWTTVAPPPATAIAGNAFLNSAGQFVSSLIQFSDFTIVPYILNGTALVPVLNGPPPPNQFGIPSVNTLGYNVAGTIIASVNNNIVLIEGGELVDLFPLIENPQGWDPFFLGPTVLGGINDQGQIFGTSTFEGQPRAFVLTPNEAVPEPGTLPLAGAATALLLYLRRRIQ